MAEEVKIRVVQEAQGTGLKDTARDASVATNRLDELKAKVAELNRLEQAYTESGNTTAARSVRTERIPFARELRELERQQRQAAGGSQQDAHVKAHAAEMARQSAERDLRARRQMQADDVRVLELRAAGQHREADAMERTNAIRRAASKHERDLKLSREEALSLATREVDAVRAIEKARSSRLGSLAYNGAMMAGRMLGIPMAEGVSGLMAGGGPAAAAERIAILAFKAAASFAERGTVLKMLGMEGQERLTSEHIQGVRSAGFEGTAAGARMTGDNLRAEIATMEERQKRLDFEAKARWSAPTTWGNAIMPLLGGMSDAQLEAERNRQGMRERQVALKEQDHARRVHVERDVKPEIQAAEQIARGEMAAARATQARLDYHRHIKQLIEQTGNTPEGREVAFRGADAKFAADLRQRQMAMGALINARTGVASAARIVAAGERQWQERRDAVAAQRIEEQTNLIRQQHEQTIALGRTPQFSAPPLVAP